jgi:hypothetical protein
MTVFIVYAGTADIEPNPTGPVRFAPSFTPDGRGVFVSSMGSSRQKFWGCNFLNNIANNACSASEATDIQLVELSMFLVEGGENGAKSTGDCLFGAFVDCGTGIGSFR